MLQRTRSIKTASTDPRHQRSAKGSRRAGGREWEVDVELGDELGQDIHRLADDKMIEHRQPVAGDAGRARSWRSPSMRCALVGQRDFEHVHSPASRYRGGVMNDAGEVNFDRGIRRNAYRLVQRQIAIQECRCKRRGSCDT